MTLTTYLSSLIIRDGDGVGWPLIFLHIESGMKFDQALESTKQVCTL